jgi:hypothetical protein
MLDAIQWNFIPMFVRRFLYKRCARQIESLNILDRLLIEIKMFEAYTFSNYTIRRAAATPVVVFTNNLYDLFDYVTIMQKIVMDREYVSDEWKDIRFNYGRLCLDEYFSSKGFDIHPEATIGETINAFRNICVQIKLTESVRRTYYLRHFKPLLEDGIEIIHKLRTML